MPDDRQPVIPSMPPERPLPSNWKKEARKQWDEDACGSNTVQNLEPGSREYYRAVRKHRFERYAPWLEGSIPFSQFAEASVLEIGVGLGSDHFRFARAGCKMFGVDLSRTHLEETVRHLGLEGLTTRPLLGDAEMLPFGESSFDLVYAFGVLHHTPEPERALAEIHRVLKPGGRVLISLYHKYSWFLFFQVLLYNGLVKGGLWKKGWRRLMSEIEHRQDVDSALPLVRVYSRRQAKRLLHRFERISAETHHVQAQDFAYLHRLLKDWPRSRLESLLRFGGWYVVAQARKPSA